MAPVLLKYVVSFSSQDSRYPAESLLDSDGCKKWLCASGEKSGRLEAEFQMERACTISHLDIGAQFVFSVQVLVGRSSWPCGKDYVTLLPSSTFLSPADCRLAKNRTVIRMFKKEDFDAGAASEKWDRIRFICCQPFRKDTQFGLSLLKIVSDDDRELTNTSSADDVSSSTLRTSLLSPSTTTSSSSPSSNSEKTALNSSPNLSSLMSKSPFSPLQKSTKEIAKLKSLGVTSVEGQYSRAGQLLLAATGQAVRYKPPSTNLPTRPSETPPKDGDFQGAPSKKRKTIEDEITEFVNTIDYTKLDLETFTFADLRHQFEKQKFRKLSKEERKVLVAAATKALEAIAVVTDSEEKQFTKESNKCSKTVSTGRQSIDCSPRVSATSLGGKEQNVNNERVDQLPGRQNHFSPPSAMPFVRNKGVKRPSDKDLGQSHNSCLDSLTASGLNSDVDHPPLQGKDVFQPKRKLVMANQTMSPVNFIKTNQRKNNKKQSSSSKTSSQFTAEAISTNLANTTDNVWLSKSSPIGLHHSPAAPQTAHRKGFSSVNSTMSSDLFPSDQGFREAVEHMVQCPLCSNIFPSDVIAVHASNCLL